MAWVALFALLTLMFGDILEQQVNPNQSLEMRYSESGVPEVVLKRNRAGHYVATGAINQQPVTFLLDTGATDVAVSASLAQRLNLPLGATMASRTANGVIQSRQTRLDEVQLGAITLTNVNASVLPAMPDNEVLLGMSFLKHLELVQRGDSLTLRQHGG